jgi:hypothetical protein
VVFIAANLRLTGSDKPAETLDDLRAAESWTGHPASGDEGLVWTLSTGVHFQEKAGFGKVFDCREYPRLTFRWKLSNNDEQARPIILRVQCGDKSLDYHAQAIQLDPALESATVEVRDGVQFGTLRYSGWFTPGTKLCRQIALTSSGALIVRDTLVPGESVRGMVAGPIWHMVNVWSKDAQQTVFAREPLQPGRPVTFISVLLPHDRGSDAAALANAITIDASASDRVHIKLGGNDQRIEFPDENQPVMKRTSLLSR